MPADTIPVRRRLRHAAGPVAALLAIVLIAVAVVAGQLQTRPANAAAHTDHNHYSFFDPTPGGGEFAPAVDAARTDDLAPVIAWDYGTPNAPVTANSIFWWGAAHPGDGAFKRLHIEHSGKCLGVYENRAIQYTCNDNPDHFWAVVDEGWGKGKLKNLSTGTCLNLGRRNGEQATLTDCADDARLLRITSTGITTADHLTADRLLTQFPHDAGAKAQAGQRAADIADREYKKELGGNDHASGLGCNFYTGQINGPSARCRLVGHSSWGRGEWCADFVHYAWREADDRIDTSGLDGYAESFKRYGSVNLTWHPAGSGYTPRPGDAVVFNPNSDGRASHVAIVFQTDSTGATYILSGNAGSGEISYRKLDAKLMGSVQGFTSPRLRPAR
ncbi:CHAP domain-containing protein [Streptomyces sp. A7024]|uniref:CHAP domain-containing protein n=1 Tax=Streptomyces coryli TaxID=1128680 RepID=A0A6G4U848_9ACTN|nr:CHAP domain-containing protein [Streptomyces coryli]NGN68415.1 CHAP domain-containing protein [Streptomyces coryli]